MHFPSFKMFETKCQNVSALQQNLIIIIYAILSVHLQVITEQTFSITDTLLLISRSFINKLQIFPIAFNNIIIDITVFKIFISVYLLKRKDILVPYKQQSKINKWQLIITLNIKLFIFFSLIYIFYKISKLKSAFCVMKCRTKF